MTSSANFYSGKRVAITGGVGSVGREVLEQLLKLDVSMIRIIDNNESGLFDLETSIKDPRVTFFHCDICHEGELSRVLSNIDLCFHAAALKHVPSCERSPFSAVGTNILGVQALIRAALANDVEKVLFTSSDKAVNPTNVMGTSKLMGERLFTASNFLRAGMTSRTVFASTRFGNVAGSRGSVIPLFCEQIAKGGPITLTDRRMTRFVMSLGEAAAMVIESMAVAHGGEVFITKMPVLKIEDLAQAMIDLLAPLAGLKSEDIKIIEVGGRPGEKLWEELSAEEESRHLLESDKYLIVLPAIASKDVLDGYKYATIETKKSDRIYHSANETAMTLGEVREFLLKDGILSEELRRRLMA